MAFETRTLVEQMAAGDPEGLANVQRLCSKGVQIGSFFSGLLTPELGFGFVLDTRPLCVMRP